MRSFQQLVLTLFALLVCAFAQSSESYDATVYITSTVYRVNTVTMSGSAAVANMTSTVSAQASAYPTPSLNGTASAHPTVTGAKPPQFTGAASAMTAQAYLAALAAGAVYLAL